MTQSKLQQIHKLSTNHRASILKSRQCGCFYCLNTFTPDKITEWCDTDEQNVGQTVLCPFCCVDSVLADFDVEITTDLLKSMKEYWF